MTTAKKTPGLIGLETWAHAAYRVTALEDTDSFSELVEVHDRLSGEVTIGVKALVQVALAARQVHGQGCAPETCGGSGLDPCSLGSALEALERWERSL